MFIGLAIGEAVGAPIMMRLQLLSLSSRSWRHRREGPIGTQRCVQRVRGGLLGKL